MEGVELPVGVPDGVLVEASDVLKRSPLLGVVTRLFSVEYKFTKVAIGFLGQRSI